MIRYLFFSLPLFFIGLAADIHVRPHPIDIAFEEKLDFMGSNAEMVQNIGAAENAWREEIAKQMALLLPLLSEAQQALLKDSQVKWESAHAAERAFRLSDREQLRSMVGREGEIGLYMESMQKIRARALELADWVALYQRSSQ